MASITTSIVIVNWNTKELLAQCLHSLGVPSPEAAFEVIVVDNASQDGSQERIRSQFPSVRLIENKENLGFAEGTNQGILASQGKYILLLNSDTILPPKAVEQLVAFMEAHADAGIVGPQLVNADGTFQASFADFPSFFSETCAALGLTSWVFGTHYPSYPPSRSQVSRPVDWVGGACLMAHSQAVSQVGLLDVNYFMYFEETDWCRRFRDKGWRVYYLPAVRVVHLSGQSNQGEVDLKPLWLHRGRIRFLSQGHHQVSVWLFRRWLKLIALAKTILWGVRAVIPSPHRSRARRKAHANLQVVLSEDA